MRPKYIKHLDTQKIGDGLLREAARHGPSPILIETIQDAITRRTSEAEFLLAFLKTVHEDMEE